MCILFLYVNANPGLDKYKFILASNRDEFFHRPTKLAHFWSQYPDIVGGMDMEPGKEGGTWLAVSKNRKVAILLNILTSNPAGAPDKLGRGSLVNDYLNDKEIDGYDYCKKLQSKADLYNPFNLVTIDLKKEIGPEVSYYSSASLDGTPLRLTTENFYAFGNSVIETPFMKVEDGLPRMKETVNAYNSTNQKQCLLDGLLEILKCRKQFSDPQMKLQAPNLPPEFLANLSSKFCLQQSSNYGSRTHTVILIDNQDQVEFHEWTMEETDLSKSTDTNWIHSEFQFPLH